MLLAIAVSGILLVALTSALFVMLTQRQQAQTRLDEARGPQFANQYFTDDVQAAAQVLPSPSVASCSPAVAVTPVTYVLNLQFQTFTDARQLRTRAVTYAVVGSGTEKALVRYSCSSDTANLTLPLATPLTGGTTTTMSRSLRTAPAVATNCNGVARLVCLSFTTQEGQTFTLSGATRKDAP